MIRRDLGSRIEALWQRRGPFSIMLLPLTALYCAVVCLRHWLYRRGLIAVERVGVPVIVVGNLSVGGTGKTPLVSWLAHYLTEQGYRPGLVARGYGGRAGHWPQAVTADSDPAQVGDEPVCLVRASGCPMWVGPDRVAAARALLAAEDCTVIISDDGLQHYRLGRDIEIAVIDGERRFGNGWCLPSGPLREPRARLQAVDLVVANGVADAGEYRMQVVVDVATHLKTGNRRELTAFAAEEILAVAGIGRPQRFFTALRAAGLHMQTLVFPDHHDYRPEDLPTTSAPVLMTDKDAVKWQRFARDNDWSVGTRVSVADGFGARLLELLKSRDIDEVRYG